MEDARSLADLLRRQKWRMRSREAMLFNGRRSSYADLDTAASKVANQLIDAGVAPHEHVAYLGKNSDLFYEIWFGALKARATLVALNFRLAAPELAYILRDCFPRFLFVGGEFATLAEQAIAGIDVKPEIAILDGPGKGVTEFSEWREQGSPMDPMLRADPQDNAILLYTSGTTGHPKGVQLTNANWLAFAELCPRVEGLAYRVGDPVMNAMPLFHVAGTNIGIAGLSQGSRLVIVADIIPADVLRLIDREGVRHAFFVPSVIQLLMDAPEIVRADLSSMQSISYGASPIAEDLLRDAQSRFSCDFLQFYGMTETTGGGASLSPAAHHPSRRKLRSCGVPWPGVEMKLVDAEGRELGTNEIGEILIRTPTLMKGYRCDPEATREAIGDGWMHTGDAAYRDEEGYFYICDRVKDMIVTGGENVYPAEVDNAIFSHPDVADVAVIGVPDAKWGEAVKAVVVLKPDAAPDAASILSWARERIANYKVPKSVDFVDALPRNPSGKVLRRELRRKYWERQDRLVG